MNTTIIGASGVDRWASMFGGPTPPATLTRTADTQRTAHPKPTDPEARDIGWTGVNLLKSDSTDGIRHYLADAQDAGRAWASTENADLWVLRYAYQSHKPMEAWLANKPSDGKLKLNVITTPSWHVGSDNAAMTATAKKFALANTYHAEVIYADGTRESKTFKVNGNTPEWSSVSPTFEIDLNKHPGDIRVRVWAQGSAGVGGYIEARETIIHN